MFSDKEVLLKSLHVCLKLPIVVFNSEFSIIKEYRSDRTTYFFYDYKKLLTDNIKKTKGEYKIFCVNEKIHTKKEVPSVE